MKVYKISHAELEKMVQGWSETAQVFLPNVKKQAADRGADCAPGWMEFDGSLPVVAVGPSKSSLKTFFFPQPETLQTYTLHSNDPDYALPKEPAKNTVKQIVFGVRPCDGRSVVLNNLPYKKDPFYQANLERTALVGFTCGERLVSCFCEDVGGSPVSTEGLDIALSEADGGYLAAVITDKGAELVGGSEFAEAAAASFPIAEFPDSAKLESLKAKDLNSIYNALFWKELGESCLNCGACTFLCPTCYCFDIQDEVVSGQGRRIRLWDSCMFPLYSLHTSGYNPRGQKVQRVRNRFLHKLKYFPDRFGPFSCVGCGRCVQECPVNIDIREVMDDLLAVE